MSRLWIKLTLAFLVVALVAVATVALLSARATGEEFRQYVVAAGTAGQTTWADQAISYYADHGGWDGVGTLLATLGPGGAGWGRGRMNGAGPNLAIADASGQVVASRSGEMVGERVPDAVLAQGIPLALKGAPIGTLLALRSSNVVLDTQEQAFLDRVRISVVWAAALAIILALALGLFFSRAVTAPIEHLTKAAAAITSGDLKQHVTIRGQDEISKLGHAFNGMAVSLAEAETLRKNLVADVAHELRTPLTIIQGTLQAILDGIYPLEMAQVADLYDETQLLTRLVDDLHELTLADAGQLRLDRAPVDVVALARAAIARFGAAAEAAQVELALEAEETVPAISGDADRLEQVLRNLISNALRHTPAGGRVVVSVQSVDGYVRLQVADTGTGIAAEDLPHLFDRFYRGDKSRSRRGGGAGLGLAIVRQLVIAHGGQISVDSRDGAGATFMVVLPTA